MPTQLSMPGTVPLGVLFVCLGNICRSPMAKGLFLAKAKARGLTERFEVESAGTSGYHVGDPPDPGSVRACGKQGIDISRERARQVTRADFARFDYVIALDRSNHRDLLELDAKGKALVHLLREFDPQPDTLDVPDPWGEGYSSFERCCAIVDRSTQGLLEHIVAQHGLR